MFPALDISTSGLVAQRMRMNAISSNLANISTTHNEQGEARAVPAAVRGLPDRRERRGQRGGGRAGRLGRDRRRPSRGCGIEPGHPDAIKDGPHKGYVAYPNINMMTEFTDALEAARAYEANLGAMEITKDLEQQTLRILA